MERVTITEFLHLTRISRGDLLTMLEHGELRGVFNDAGELQIDISNLTPEDLARRSTAKIQTLDPDTETLIEEVVASEIVHQLESIIDEALELANEWESRKNS